MHESSFTPHAQQAANFKLLSLSLGVVLVKYTRVSFYSTKKHLDQNATFTLYLDSTANILDTIAIHPVIQCLL